MTFDFYNTSRQCSQVALSDQATEHKIESLRTNIYMQITNFGYWYRSKDKDLDDMSRILDSINWNIEELQSTLREIEQARREDHEIESNARE